MSESSSYKLKLTPMINTSLLVKKNLATVRTYIFSAYFGNLARNCRDR